MMDLDAVAELFTLGFTLGGKTLLIDRKLPEIEISYEIRDTPTTWKHVYKALEDSVIETCQNVKNPGMLLSGGMDSRIIAGIISDNDFDIPYYTIGALQKEIVVSKAIAGILKLRHFVLPTRESQETLNAHRLRDISFHTMGTLRIPHFLSPIHSPALERTKARIETFITGLYGTELWADSITTQSHSLKDFCGMLYRNRCQIQTIEKEYHVRALSNLLEYCRGLDIRSLLYETYIKSRAITETYTLDKKRLITPILNSEVLSATFSLPIEMRRDKRINHLIIKHEFPKLKSIPDILARCKHRILSRVKKGFRKTLNLRRKEVFDFDFLFRSNPFLKEYIRRGIPSISNRRICENVIDCFYNREMDISKPMSCFLSYFFLRDDIQTDSNMVLVKIRS